jgi:hypothetical protein
MTRTDQRLRRLESLLSAIGDPDARWLADALQRRRHFGGSIDARLTDAGRIERDRLLVALRQQHFPALSVNAAALTIAALTRRYEAIGWPRDRDAEAIPPRLDHTPEGIIWRILAAGQTVPRWRQLLSILQRQGSAIAPPPVVS